MNGARAGTEPATSPRPGSAFDRLSGAFGSVRELLVEGAVEVVTPPGRDPEAPIDAKTVIQIDGDVVTIVRDEQLSFGTHFDRVRSRLAALERMRRAVLAVIYAPPLAVLVFQIGSIASDVVSDLVSGELSAVGLLWPRGVGIALYLVFLYFLFPRVISWIGAKALVALPRLVPALRG